MTCEIKGKFCIVICGFSLHLWVLTPEKQTDYSLPCFHPNEMLMLISCDFCESIQLFLIVTRAYSCWITVAKIEVRQAMQKENLLRPS